MIERFQCGESYGAFAVYRVFANNFDIIEKFAVYFREVSAEIIKSYEKTKIIIPDMRRHI